jgi:peroxin-6
VRDLLSSALSPAFASAVQVSVLLKGARGAGKRTLIRRLADELGFSLVEVDCYDITGDTLQVTQGSLQARLEKATTAAPAIVLLHHVEALAKKSESSATGRQPPMVKVLEDALGYLREASRETQWSCVLVGTTCDAESVPGEILGCFKQDVEMSVSVDKWLG